MNNEERDKKTNQPTKLTNQERDKKPNQERDKKTNQVKIPNPNLNFQSNAKHRRTNSTSSNLSVVDLNESDKDNWSFFTSTQNLATVLNNPNQTRSVSDQIFTRDWGSYFNETTHLSTNVKQFKMKREYVDKFIQNLNNRDKFKKHLNESRKEIYFPDQNETIQLSKQNQQSTNLENLIPAIYLKEDFKLENLETFKEILNENGEQLNNRLSDNELIKQTIKDLEKRLTDYLDVVEEHLAKQISVRFREFFHIMNAMELVMEQLNTTIREVTLVRTNCNRLQETLVYPSLKNIQLTKKKANLQSVYEKIRIMATVHETQPTIQNFLSTYDYVGALDLIAATQEVYDQDLVGLTSFRHLNSQLSEIKKVIIEMMKEDFVKFLTQEWNRPFTKLELELKKYSIANDSLNFERVDNFNFDKDKLNCMVVGMLKVDYLDFVDTFKEEAFTTIQTWIKQTVIECLSNDESFAPKSSLPFDQLNELKFQKWLAVLNKIFEDLFIVLKRIQIIHVVIGRTVNKFELNSKSKDELTESSNDSKLNGLLENTKDNSTINSTNFFDTNEDEQEANDEKSKSDLVNKLDKCLLKICEFCHTECSKIINSKTNENSFISRVSFDEYLTLVRLTEKFTASNEMICSVKVRQLKLALRTQTNKYVTKFHDDHTKEILSILDIEQWKPFDQISPEFQQIINDLIDYNCSFSDLHRFRKKMNRPKNQQQKNLKYLEVNGEKFVIVYTVISFVYIIIEYCAYAADIQSIAPDLLTRLVLLLKKFNSKVMKLVLMAEALQISGLKTITARHLIVANRCLKLILILLQYVKNHFTSILTEKTKHMLKYFDEVKVLYNKHIEETIKKVIDVVKVVLVAKINKWEAKPPVPSNEFKEISIHLQRLYSNIQETLPEEELNQLLYQIYESFTELLKEQMTKLKIVKDGGPQHFLVKQEIAFLKESLVFLNDDKLNWATII